MPAKSEYPYPKGKVLTEDLTRRVNNVVGFLHKKTAFASLYIDPLHAFIISGRYPTELSELYETYSPLEKKVIKHVYGSLMNHLRDEAIKKLRLDGLAEKEELNPTLEYVQRFTPLGLREARGISWTGSLFIYHSVRPF